MSVWAIETCTSANYQRYVYPDPLGLRGNKKGPLACASQTALGFNHESFVLQQMGSTSNASTTEILLQRTRVA